MQSTIAARRAVPAAVGVQPKTAIRLLFVDNIRVFLTVLVLLHHLMITYAGSGGWDYQEGRQDILTTVIGNWFCSINQAYFMGLFLLISAYFVPGSFERKGAARFLKDRLIRLGIPLAVYSWIINPLFWYLYSGAYLRMPFWGFFPAEYFSGGDLIGQGPLWFVEVLLIFSLLYVLWRLVARVGPAGAIGDAPFSSNRAIALFALLLGIAGFLVRTVFPIDYNFKPLNLQFPFFAQYIALFVVGLVAYRRNWLLNLPEKTARLWLIIAGLLILVWVPMMLALGAPADTQSLKGGLHWQSLVNALWESFLCVSACIGAIYLFRRYLNQRGKLAGFLVPNAYTAYLIHAPVIITLAVAIQSVMLYPLLKWVLVAAVAVPLCFLLSSLVRKLPYTEHVL